MAAVAAPLQTVTLRISKIKVNAMQKSSQTTDSASNVNISTSSVTEPKPSYVKLAMRNMVRKGGTSMKHFAMTTVGLLAVLVGLAYLTR